MKRYGEIVLIDSTYKTTKYSLPLFSIVVKTNVSYIIVGVFVVQWETSDSIQEALEIFKQWNAEWKPKYFITDYSDAEINAITACFHLPVYICDFHRQQAWVRWFSKKDNISNIDEKNILLSFFRKLADARSNDEFCYIESTMRSSEAWQNNPKVQRYFNSTWLPVKEKWTKAFFDDEYLFIINTNNGIETQHKVLKHFYLNSHIDKSLCGVLDVIMNEFLDDAFKTYVENNDCLDSKYKQYNTVIPEFLYDRPSFFIRHVYQRYVTARSVYSRHSILTLNNDVKTVFLVKSEAKNVHYYVDFTKPKCTCDDFFRYRFPCKHLCAVMLYVTDYSFNDLPSNYRNSPFLSIDPEYSIFRTDF
ncbi:uncharacterized protein LOC135838315 isoform X1 [Planococcus citri]